jgi:hypothetical protein
MSSILICVPLVGVLSLIARGSVELENEFPYCLLQRVEHEAGAFSSFGPNRQDHVGVRQIIECHSLPGQLLVH